MFQNLPNNNPNQFHIRNFNMNPQNQVRVENMQQPQFYPKLMGPPQMQNINIFQPNAIPKIAYSKIFFN